MKLFPEQPIGVFDSGIGGLTVVKEILNILPNENLVYFGDTARVPYGNKSDNTIKEYSVQNTKFLLSHNVKIIVVACNSASSVALDKIIAFTSVPVLGVIEPGSAAAVSATKNGKIAVIGTNATISSNSYQKAINNLNNKISVFGKACPLFVPIVEEGWYNHKIAKMTAAEYLEPLSGTGFDTMVLGCTHYPLLKTTIKDIVGSDITLIDSGVETARKVKEILHSRNLLNTQASLPKHNFFVSDLPHKFKDVGEMFLNRKIDNLLKVDF